MTCTNKKHKHLTCFTKCLYSTEPLFFFSKEIQSANLNAVLEILVTYVSTCTGDIPNCTGKYVIYLSVQVDMSCTSPIMPLLIHLHKPCVPYAR